MAICFYQGVLRLLRLNKFFLALVVIWAFVLAFLAIVSVPSALATSTLLTCEFLYHVMWVFLVLGGVACLIDAILESIQHTIYVFWPSHLQPSVEHVAPPTRYRLWQFFNVPTRYYGIRYWWSDSRPGLSAPVVVVGPGGDEDYDAFCFTAVGLRVVAWIFLMFEMLLRFAGNVFLYSLFVLTGVGQYTGDRSLACPCVGISPLTALCAQTEHLWWTQSVRPLFWMAVALTVARVFWSWTYKDFADPDVVARRRMFCKAVPGEDEHLTLLRRQVVLLEDLHLRKEEIHV
jgi:hypothetical protein